MFQAAAAGDAGLLVIVGVLASAVAAFFYIRVIVLMFFTDPVADPPAVVRAPGTVFSVAVAAVITLVFGIAPQPLLDMAARAGEFIG